MGEVSALTGSIGNARMVLRMTEGERMDKCILVKNVNDVPVTITMTAGGDLADYITLKEQTFDLSAGSEKNACFTIRAGKEGTTETKVNVLFSPVEDENGNGGSNVGLSSTIIVIAKKKTSIFDNFFSDSDNSENGGNENKFNLFIVSLTITAILFMLLLVLILSQKKHQVSAHHVSAIEQTKIEQNKSGVKAKK